MYLAEDHKFQTEVALKMLKKELISNENIKKRFLAEARSMFRMAHLNVIRVTDLIDEEDTVAFVMDYVDGETLKDFLDRKGRLTDEEIKEIFAQMLDAVGYVHEQKLVHRDIKPSNFMLDKSGRVKLMDFGIAKNTDADAAEYTQTGTGMQMGTPMYMSPEQITETKSVNAQSDIYSLGVVLWQMVTGQKPYDTKTLSNFHLQTKIVTERLGTTNTIWDKVIQKATAKEGQNRFASCTEVKNDIIELSFSEDQSNEFTEIEDVKTQLANKVNEDATQIEQQTKNNEDINGQNVTIGIQVWTIKNLNVDKFRNGDPIPEAKTNEEWKRAGENQEPAWCYYNNNPNNGTRYGKLYNWFAVNDPRGLAPNGFHIPSKAEWIILADYLGGKLVAGTKMKSASGWPVNGNGTNGSVFSGLPGGYRHENGIFTNFGSYGCWWSSAEAANTSNAWCRALSDVFGDLVRYNIEKKRGLSVRCVKD